MARSKSSYTAKPDPQDWCGAKAGDTAPLIYFSGNTPYNKLTTTLIQHGMSHYCFSFAYADPQSPDAHKVVIENFRMCREAGVRIFMDSGAFTFQVKPWRATPETLASFRDAYIANVKQYRKHYDFYATFDYAQHGPTVWEQTQKLIDAGLGPTPAFHITTSLDWLRRYADAGYKLIGLGSAMKSSSKEQARFYTQAFNLGDKLGLRFHGFAVTGKFMFDYPWHSVDSATWLKVAINGGILFVDPARKKVQVAHTTKGRMRPGMDERIKALGFKPRQLETDFQYRALFNMMQFLRAEVRPELRRDNHRWQSIL